MDKKSFYKSMKDSLQEAKHNLSGIKKIVYDGKEIDLQDLDSLIFDRS